MWKIVLAMPPVALLCSCGEPQDTCDVLGGPNEEGCHTSGSVPDGADTDDDDTEPVGGPHLTAEVTADNGVTPYTFTASALIGGMSQTQWTLTAQGDDGGSIMIIASTTTGTQLVGAPGALTSFVFDDPAHFGSTGDFPSVGGTLDITRFEGATAALGGYGSFVDAAFDVELQNTAVQPVIRLHLLGSMTNAAVLYNR